jgi:hypothetical protein
MSFDPFHEQQPQRDPVPRPPLESAVPNGPAPDMRADPRAARERILFPAILLIIVGVVNFLFMGFCAFSTLVSRMQPIETQRANLNQNPQLKQMYDDLEKQGYKFEDVIRMGQWLYTGLSVSNLLTAFLSLFAGIRMLQLRNYGLVFFAAVVSAIPCVSGSGCCCLGELAGIYAVVMLLQTDIRDAFR